jgi:hypothetical protein
MLATQHTDFESFANALGDLPMFRIIRPFRCTDGVRALAESYPAFTLDTEARGLLPFYAILVPWTLLPSYAKMPSLLPYPHPMDVKCTSGYWDRQVVP